MQNNIKKETVLGILFVTAIVFLIFVSLTISKLNIFSSNQYIKVVFDSVRGLKKGDSVRVLGMEAGTIDRLKILPNNKVRVVLKIFEPIELREDYKITVEESSILGGNFIGINPGTPGKNKVNLKTPLQGQGILPGLDAFGKLIEENREDVKKLLSDASKIIKDTAQGKGSLGKFITDDTLYINLKETSESLKNTTKQIEKGEGTLGKLISDDKLYIDLKESVESLKNTTKQIEKGEGTIGKLIFDDKLYLDLKESVESLKKTLKQIESNEGFLGKLIYDKKLGQQLSDAGDSATKFLEPVIRTKVFVEVGAKYYPESAMTISDIFIRIEPRESKYFILGGSILSLNKRGNITFEDQSDGQDQTFIKANVQIAYKFRNNSTTFRTGLMESKFGGAIDLDLVEPVTDSLITELSLSFEIRDAYNSLQKENIDENLPAALTRAYASVKLGKHFKTYVGLSRLFSDTPEFMIGISFGYLDEDIKSFVALLGLSR
ncbi:MAG: MlaD family protein [Planctomycetota bacterium]